MMAITTKSSINVNARRKEWEMRLKVKVFIISYLARRKEWDDAER